MVIGILGALIFIACLAMVIVSLVSKKRKRYWLIGLGLGMVMFIVGIATSSPSTTPPSTPTSVQTIDYQVLRRWDIPAGGIGGELLVSENATKEEVLALASSLRSKYLSEGYIQIVIFDSLEAYKGIDDPTYPEEERLKHQLVDIARNPTTGYDEIRWIAEGRDY